MISDFILSTNVKLILSSKLNDFIYIYYQHSLKPWATSKKSKQYYLFLFRFIRYQKFLLKLSLRSSLFLGNICQVSKREIQIRIPRKIQRLRMRNLTSQTRLKNNQKLNLKMAKASLSFRNKKMLKSQKLNRKKLSKVKRNKLILTDPRSQYHPFSDSTKKTWIKSRHNTLT